VASLLGEFDTKTWIVFDSDEYIDLRARRPRLRIEDGVRGRIFGQARAYGSAPTTPS